MHRPPGITALALFFVFGTVMSGLTAVMLSFPRSVIEPLWPEGTEQQKIESTEQRKRQG
jgi:hypothetical protein